MEWGRRAGLDFSVFSLQFIMASSCLRRVGLLLYQQHHSGEGEASTAGHIKTPHTWAWLLAVQGTFTVNMDSQFNENCFSWAIAERDHGQTRACVQIMAQIPNRVVIIAINPGTPRPCADSLISSCLRKVLSSLCHSCFPTEIHLKPSPSVFLYRRWSH